MEVHAKNIPGMNYHLSMYLCEHPGHVDAHNERVAWDCGNNDPGLREAGPLKGWVHAGECREFRSMAFGWSHTAPPLVLPADTGLEVGGDSGSNYVVLAIHYESGVQRFFNKRGDDSGLILTMVPKSDSNRLNRVGTIVLDSFAVLPPHTVTHTEIACRLNQSLTIHPLMFTPHEHDAGRTLSFWKVSPSGSWSMLGKYQHQHHEPQRYYPLTNSGLSLSQGDFMAMRCVHNNTSPKTLSVG